MKIHTLLLLLVTFSVANAVEHSVAPIAGYSATYSLALGGGYFFKADKHSGRLIALYTLSNAFQFQPRLNLNLFEAVDWETDSTLQKGFEPYYGEGPNTAVSNRKDYPMMHTETFTGVRFSIKDHFSFAPRARLRTYHSLDNVPAPFLPGERLVSLGVGLNTRADYRGTGDHQDEGFLQENNLWFNPNWSEAHPGDFATLETRFTYGIPLLFDMRLVLDLDVGTTFGNSDYCFEFSLGGSKKLRGYLDNRFRGKHFYLQSAELRAPLNDTFALAVYTDVGEATNDLSEFHPKASYGGGLRIALPPDRIQWARIDIGFGQDSWALYADFGLPF